MKSLLEILNILGTFTKRLSTRPGVDHCSILKIVARKWFTDLVKFDFSRAKKRTSLHVRIARHKARSVFSSSASERAEFFEQGEICSAGKHVCHENWQKFDENAYFNEKCRFEKSRLC